MRAWNVSHPCRNDGVGTALADTLTNTAIATIPIGQAPQRSYVLALSRRPDGGGVLEPLAAFTTNPAASAIANALGPIRQIVRGEGDVERRCLVIAPGTPDQIGPVAQIPAN